MSRIVHIINHLGCGGAENLVRGMARHLAGRGWQVTLCALTPPMHDAADLEVRCVDARGPWDVAGYLRLRAMLRQLRPALVHVHLLWGELWGVPAARDAGAAVVITGHCVHDARARSALARAWSRAVVRRADATTAISRAVARYRVERCGDAQERIWVVPNGIEVERYHLRRGDSRARLGLPVEATVIGTAARLHPDKGVDLLVRAASLLRPHTRLLLVGAGPQEAHLRALARRLGVAGRIVFAGAVAATEVPEALAAMDIFVLPSRREGLGLAALEAMAAGLPVVAADCGGIAEVVEHRRSGLLFRAGDVGALARGLDLLLDQPHLAARLGTAARVRARAHFSLERMVTRMEGVYRQAVAARTARIAGARG